VKPVYRILIVDDSRAIRSSLTNFLKGIERAEFDIREAENGIDALKCLGAEDGEVDLVVTDLSMPRMDGLELIRHLRANPDFERLPILFLTAHEEEQKKIDVFRAGATDYVVKPFLPYELESRIMGYLERKRAFETIQKHERSLQESVTQARLTQESLLPEALPKVAGASLTVKYVPAEHLSGDFYDFYALPDDRLGILLADVSGHGIAAALVTFLLAGIFKNTAPNELDPQALLGQCCSMAHGKIPEGRYATALYAVFDPSDLTLTYSSAGHPPGVLLRQNGEIEEFSLEGSPLGLVAPEKAEYQRGVVQLSPGDRILLQTDALLEVENDRGQPLGLQRIKRFLAKNTELTPAALLEAVLEHGLTFSEDSHCPDDVTLIMMEVGA
jgi:serine phosphatase RsbU (regulator of sigma subunit)